MLRLSKREVFLISNFYPLLISIGILFLAGVSFFLFISQKIIFGIICLIPLVFLIPIDITIYKRYPIKKRIISISQKRLNNNVPCEDVFISFTGDPCLRLITKYMLLKTNQLDKYESIHKKAANKKFGYPEKIPATIQHLIDSGEMSEEEFYESIL